MIPAGDTAYKALDAGGSLFCLISGRMVKYECENLLDDLLTPVDHDDEVIIFEGETFGESSLFPDICSRRAETVTALLYSKLAVLSVHDIITLSKEYPEIEVHLHPQLLPHPHPISLDFQSVPRRTRVANASLRNRAIEMAAITMTTSHETRNKGAGRNP